MDQLSKNIIITEVFSESECLKVIDSKGEFVTSPQDQQDDGKYIIVPDESDYTFGHTNFPYWHVDFSDENEWIVERVLETVSLVNANFFKFRNQGLWNMGIKEYSNEKLQNNQCTWHFDDMSRGKRLGCAVVLHRAVEGGEFEIFNGEKVSIDVKVGEIVIFPAFFFHRVKPVLKGKRITLLTWMYGEPITL